MKDLYQRWLVFILVAGFLNTRVLAQIAVPGEALPEWREGFLDIHHINTGRGNAAYCIFPDGTTLLIDAGELSPLDERTFTPRNATIRPDSSKKPFEWIAGYIHRVMPAGNAARIDYALITHFHDDHFGAWYPAAPSSKNGNYVLTGITGVSELLPVRTLIDRGYPGYNYPYDIKRSAAAYGGGEIAFNKTMQNYFAFIQANKKRGLEVKGLQPGSNSEIILLNKPEKYRNFFVRNVKANQWVWTGKDSAAVALLPSGDSTKTNALPDENMLSLAISINYGPFTYYSGGDNPGNVFPGDNPLRDLETPIAKAIGEVDVATMDHHGNRDAINEFMIRTLRPAVWIGQTWSADHPGHEVLNRLTNKYIYDKPGDLFSTNMLDANRYVIGPLIDRSYKSQQGHIVVRVLPGGGTYHVIVLDDATPEIPVKAVFGPYLSKSNKLK